jgi:hypothetical protein
MRMPWIVLTLMLALMPMWSDAQEVSFALEFGEVRNSGDNEKSKIATAPRFEELEWLLSGPQEMGVDSVNFGQELPTPVLTPNPMYSLIDSLWPMSQTPRREAWGNFTFNIAFNR